jgi:peptide/nickel transport system substrate-binding protein
MRMTVRALGRPLKICLLVGAMALLVAACGGSKKSSSSSGSGTTSASTSVSANNGNSADAKYGTVLYGALPAAGTPASGGTISVGQLTGQTPTYIMPIAPGAETSTQTIDLLSNLFMPLYAGPTGAEPKVDYDQSFATSAPVGSDGDKTFTIHLKTGLKWANGAPMDANDVLFWYYLLKAAVKSSAANWGQYVPGQFPASVTSASAPNASTVVFHLNKAYNPGYFLNNQLADTDNTYAMPSTDWDLTAAGKHNSDWKNPKVALKIYNYLNKQGASVSTFASSPLWKDVSGPFKLSSFSATNSSYVLTPNPNYGGAPKAQATIDVNTYTSVTSQYTALQSGSLDVAGLDPSQLNQAKTLKSQGVAVFGGPSWGWFGGQLNFLDTTDHFNKVIAQLYAREVLDHLVDQPAIIKGVYKTAAVTAYGPVPSAPTSPYAPSDATTAPFPYSPSTAVSLLKSHGWKVVPNGQTTCAKAGTGAGECGAGIPAGTPFKFVWANVPEATSTTGPLESEALASIAKQAAGIDIQLTTKSFNFLAENYNDANPAAVKYKDDWGVNNYGGLFEDYYPTQAGVENDPGTGFNIGNYNDKTAHKLINDSVFGGNVNAVETEAGYLEKHPPVIYFPDQDTISAVNTKKVGSSADGWLALTQQALQPQYWYTIK